MRIRTSILYLSLLVALAPRMTAQAQFGRHDGNPMPRPFGFGPVAQGDVDGDGDADLIGLTPASGLRRLGLMRNRGRGDFVAEPTFSTVHNFPWEETHELQLVDLDGDGDLDLLELRNTGAKVYPNDGRGRFLDLAPAANDPRISPGFHHSAVVGDFNGDGLPDIVLGTWGRGNRLMLNAGGFGFRDGSAGLPQVASLTRAIAVFDLDGDGDLDLVFGNVQFSGTQSPGMEVYINDGKAGFAARSHSIPALHRSYSVKAFSSADFDGDGDLDLIVEPNQSTRRPVFLVNDGRGQFVDAGNAPRAGIEADLNGDGHLDLVRTIGGFDAGDGAGGFASRSTGLTPASHGRNHVVTVSDLDGDGDLDLVGANAQLFANDGRGRFSSLQRSRSSWWGRHLDLFDVDGDGDLDVLSSPSLMLSRNDGSGFFAAPASAGDRTAPDTLVTGVADVDNDGDLDFLQGRSGQDFLFRNDGTGRFSQSAWLPLERRNTWQAVLADFDGDGRVDLITESSNVGQIIRSELRLLRNVGDRFVPWAGRSVPALAERLTDLRAADLDSDGDLDLVATGSFGVRQFVNDGAARFRMEVIATGFDPRDVAIGDLDGDGDLDLATMGPAMLLWNEGVSAFRTEVLADFESGASMHLADFDLDGDLDLLFETKSARRDFVYVPTRNLLFVNDGVGQFLEAAADRLPVEVQWNGVGVGGDVDGDGDYDLLAMDGQGGVLVNRHRQVFSPYRPAVGGVLRFEFVAEPGYGDERNRVIPLLSAGALLPQPVVIPSVGRLFVDPNSLTVLTALHLAGDGTTSWEMPLPRDASLAGRAVTCQGVVVTASGEARLTNAWMEQVAR